jgi:hypothetical protein
MNDRDHFAAAALTGLLAGNPHYTTDAHRGPFCDSAFQLADAMLAARGPVAGTTESQHVAETCRGEGHEAAPPRPPASGPTLTDAERDLLRRLGPSVDAPAGRIVRISVEERKTVHGLLARDGGAT